MSRQYDNYRAFVVQRIVDGVRCAANRLRPAQLACLTTQAPEHVFNRRWFLKPGTMPPNPFGGIDQVKMNPPTGSPNLVKPAGPTDPTVTILALREPTGQPIAVYSTYSLHYVGGVPKGDISADYYGVYCDRLERLLGGDQQDPPMVALMANASSGDINNLNFLDPRPPKKPYEQIRFVAHDLAAKVQAALAKAEYQDHVALAARFRERTIARPMPTAEQIAWAKERLTKPGPKPDQVDLPWSYAQRIKDMAKRETQVVGAAASAAHRAGVHWHDARRAVLRDRAGVPQAGGDAAGGPGRMGPRRFWLHPDRQALRMGRLRDVARILRVRAARFGKAARHAAGNGGRDSRGEVIVSWMLLTPMRPMIRIHAGYPPHR